jgi:hypothetical protein
MHSSIDLLQKTLKSFPPEANAEKIEFLQAALQWSSSVMPQSQIKGLTQGHPSLHRSIALEYWKGGDNFNHRLIV